MEESTGVRYEEINRLCDGLDKRGKKKKKKKWDSQMAFHGTGFEQVP